MKNKLIKVIALTLTSAIIASSSSVMAEEDISVYIDGKQIPFDVNPIIYEERTLVPMRAIFEALGAEVSWNQETMTASAVRGNDTLSITIDSKQLYKNNEAVELDVPAMIVGDRTLVPVRAISESFDCDVQWDGEAKSVIIKTAEENNVPTPTTEPEDKKTSGIELAEKDAKALKTSKEVLRYEFEQRALPDYMFENSDSIYDLIGADKESVSLFGNAVFEQWDKAAASYVLDILINSETEYEINSVDEITELFSDAIKDAEIDAESLFEGATCLESDNGIRVGVVIFKSADSLVQCKYLGIVAAKNKKPRYFTAENDVIETDKWYFCEVTESGRGTIGTFGKKDEQTDLQNFVNVATEAYEKDMSAIVSINKN